MSSFFCDFMYSASEIMWSVSISRQRWKIIQGDWHRSFLRLLFTTLEACLWWARLSRQKACILGWLCSPLHPHEQVVCPISAAVAEHNRVGWNRAELGYTSKDFSLQWCLSHQSSGSERLCASTLSSCFCHQPRVADAWARRQELTHF